MISRMMTVPSHTADGTFDAYLAMPPPGRAPAIVIEPSIMGITDGLKETADRYASKGFIVVAIDPFWRTLPGPLGPERFPEALQRMHDWTVVGGLDDLEATLTTLKTMSNWNGRWAVLGFCFGGRPAFLALSRLGADAAVAFHGTDIHLHIDEAAQVNKPFSFHFGGSDPVVPLEQVELIDTALREKDGEIYIYDGAGHGFAQQEAQNYHPEAGPLSEQRAFELLERLKDPA